MLRCLGVQDGQFLISVTNRSIKLVFSGPEAAKFRQFNPPLQGQQAEVSLTEAFIHGRFRGLDPAPASQQGTIDCEFRLQTIHMPERGEQIAVGPAVVLRNALTVGERVIGVLTNERGPTIGTVIVQGSDGRSYSQSEVSAVYIDAQQAFSKIPVVEQAKGAGYTIIPDIGIDACLEAVLKHLEPEQVALVLSLLQCEFLVSETRDFWDTLAWAIAEVSLYGMEHERRELRSLGGKTKTHRNAKRTG